MKRKKILARVHGGKPLQQVAALPYRPVKSGIQIMLVTSRHTRRFIVPKGWPMKGKHDPEAAAQEAAEEAGVIGHCASRPLGRFRYWKRLKRNFVRISVTVFPLQVERQLAEWSEMADRERVWVTPGQAALLVDEPELVSLLSFVKSFGREISR